MQKISKLDELLPLVRKPIRYTGGEYNITLKKSPTINVGLVFPEIYELGMSNLGIKIVYHLFNRRENIQCERVFAPWPDFGDRMREHSIKPYGLETRREIDDFDLLGFSLQSELCYTTVLHILDLAGIPFRAVDRSSKHPILIAGGPATLNPRPMSSVFDAFVVGDGENVIPGITEILEDIPAAEKEDRLRALSRLPGVWVPKLHGYDITIQKQMVSKLDENTVPFPPMLPTCDITHDRYVVEVMRGCTWGCRFCQAGYTNRPLRVRSESEVLRAVEKGLRQTGWEEVSLLSFSILDYPDLLNLIRKLNEILRKRMVSISLPAMRGELFTEDLALLLKEIKKSGLTFAPETASDELRRRLNKSFSNDRLIDSIQTAYRTGWKQVKLYFMVGLPFETDADIKEITRLSDTILNACPKGSLKLSVSSFVPKPHTPFESVEFAPIDALKEKIENIKAHKKRRVEVKYQSPEVSYVEALLSRSDERIFPVIEAVYRAGGKFEEWREGFDFSRWETALQQHGISPAEWLKPKTENPWDIVDVGISKEFLTKEFQRSRLALTTENCFYEKCVKCGACDGDRPTHSEGDDKYLSVTPTLKSTGNQVIYRVKYSVGEDFRYASHLDIARAIYRALRRSDLPIKFTQGFSPIPKVSFCPPKSVGQIAKGDFFDVYLETEYFGNISRELNARFPPGIRVLDIRAINPGTVSLSSSINLINYEVNIDKEDLKKSIDLNSEVPIYVNTKSGQKDLKTGLDSLSIANGPLSCGLFYGGGQVNIYDLLSYLTELPPDQAKRFKVTRTTMFIKKESEKISPMEVK
ncbi:MAG: TIGR03960 family B12-binding radical SAM protein [candidate division WOR-3 bacterium]|nr:MAG: TIGR03960 family B12-binding radical SAM protein [candidate division WOR-3 bacterium]